MTFSETPMVVEVVCVSNEASGLAMPKRMMFSLPSAPPPSEEPPQPMRATILLPLAKCAAPRETATGKLLRSGLGKGDSLL